MKEILKLKILKIDNDGFHLAVSTKINGKKANMVVDTGASRTVFDQERIKKFLKEEEVQQMDKLSTGLGTNSMKSQMVTLNNFSLGKIEFENYHSVLLDLSHVIHSYEQIGLAPVEGVIGSDVLLNCNAIIDYSKKTLVLTSIAKKKKSKRNISKKKK